MRMMFGVNRRKGGKTQGTGMRNFSTVRPER
jgi:hypothetical protein